MTLRFNDSEQLIPVRNSLDAAAVEAYQIT